MEFSKEFNKKIKKMRRKQETCRNYVYNLKSMAFTEGFWYNHGYIFEAMLEDLKTNHATEWQAYCDNEGILSDSQAVDFLC